MGCIIGAKLICIFLTWYCGRVSMLATELMEMAVAATLGSDHARMLMQLSIRFIEMIL